MPTTNWSDKQRKNKYPNLNEATNEESNGKKGKGRQICPKPFSQACLKYQSRFLLTPSDAQYLRQYR
jgi:hypothetical protein